MYDRRLTGLFTAYHVFSTWLILRLKKCDCSPCLCYCITKQRQSSGRRDKGHAPSLRTTGFISVYPNPVLCVSVEIPETDREVAANRQQSKSHTSELVKTLRIKRVCLPCFSGRLLQHGKKTKIQCKKGRITGIVLLLWGHSGQSRNVFQNFLYFITASLLKRLTCSSFSVCVVIKHSLGDWKLLLT